MMKRRRRRHWIFWEDGGIEIRKVGVVEESRNSRSIIVVERQEMYAALKVKNWERAALKVKWNEWDKKGKAVHTH